MVLKWRRSSSSASFTPWAWAMRLGTARGSTLNRLRPVGSTSLRPCR
jgi:hypothetical protein